MVEYTIKAHPTRYGGVEFRSRLEATWAAFFDLCKWRWQYEPVDLYGWVPDFILDGTKKIAVEVKPIWEWSEFPTESLTKIELSRWSGEVLVLGNGVRLDQYQRPAIGWLAERIIIHDRKTNQETEFLDWGAASFGTFRDDPDRKLDISHDNLTFYGRMYGGSDKNPPTMPESAVRDLWNEASNLTRWKPRRNK